MRGVRGVGVNGSRLYLGLGASVVFLLGHVLPALRLGSRYVVGNGHWGASKRVTAAVWPRQTNTTSATSRPARKRVKG